MIYTKIFKRILRRLVFKFIFRNLYIYELGIFIARYTNFLLPHEEDIYGINFLNLEKKREIIDVGASDGLYFRSVKFIGVNDKFVCIEALKRNKKYLTEIKKKNKTFKFYINAAGDKNKSITIYTPFYKNRLLYNLSSYSKNECIANIKLRKFNINLSKLDFVKNKIQQKKIDHFKFKPTLLKIDVEGYENKVLLGALNTINKYRPIIYVENNLNLKKFNTINFFKKKLLKYGYKPYIFNLEKKSFFKYNKQNIRRRFFSYNVYFLIKKHFLNTVDYSH